jgi:hypothetical protein
MNQDPKDPIRHPIQPMVMVDGTLRYKENKIIRALLDYSSERGFGMNEIAARQFDNDDRVQLVQLIGYSHDGASSLSYFPDEVWEASQTMHEAGLSEDQARLQALRNAVNTLQAKAIEAVRVLTEGEAVEDMPGQRDSFGPPTTS